MTMTAYEIATKAARMAERRDGVGVMSTPPDEDGTRGLSVSVSISGFPILADGRRQVTLPEDEAAWTAARWIDGAELPIKDENDE